MIFRSMPNSNDRLSTLGFGCMRFPVTDKEKIDEPQSLS